jgi:hypothetical protein
MKRSLHCLREPTTAAEIQKWEIRQTLKKNDKTQFWILFEEGHIPQYFHPDVLDVLQAFNTYGFYRIIGLPSATSRDEGCIDFSSLKKAGCGALLFDELMYTTKLELISSDIMRHVLFLRAHRETLYFPTGLEYLRNLIMDWSARKELIQSVLLPTLAELCIDFLDE